MKNNLKRIVFLTFAFIMLVSSFAFAGNVTINGITAYDYANKGEAIDDGMDNPKAVPYKGKTYYVEEDDYDDFKEGISSAEQSANRKALDKTLGDAVNDSSEKINEYADIMNQLQPKPGEGWAMLGDNVKEGLIKILSLAIVIFWIIYIAVLIWNGVNVLIPGMYDKTQGAAQSGNNDGVSKAAGFGQRFISKNSQEAVEQENQSKWIKKELKRLIMFAIITVGLLSGVFFNILGFILKMINFGG